MTDNPIDEAPREFSLMPFWFWNDTLDGATILDQIDQMQRRGVYGFVIHPRVGLPRDCGWMSRKFLDFMHIAIDEAARRGMKVVLYDEGMYPSGSSCGQVVEKYPDLAARGLALHDAGAALPEGANVIAEFERDGKRVWIVDRRVDSFIRGLHYIGEGPAEDEPPAGDILNPRTAEAIIELVYSVFTREFKKHLSTTVLGIFTDEPSPLAKCRERGVFPGSAHALGPISQLMGRDVRAELWKLWDKSDAGNAFRDAYKHAVRLRLNQTWYKPLSDFCAANGTALCGHPDHGDEIGAQRFFHIPGQDAVWRWVERGNINAIEGRESTQAKCSSSAMIHLGRRRNSNEFCGAYGHQTTFEEVIWLANWCLVRGVNLLFPHAFYYSIRGPRKDERPPQIGLHTPEWDSGAFKAFADHCRCICYLNTDSTHICHTAILTDGDRCPWPAAATLLRRQRDFNYLDPDALLERATVDSDGIAIAGMRYRLLVIDGTGALGAPVEAALAPMIAAGRVVRWAPGAAAPGDVPTLDAPDELVARVDQAGPVPVRIGDAPDALRVRTVEKSGVRYSFLFNESPLPIEVHLAPEMAVTGIDDSATVSPGRPVPLASGELVCVRHATAQALP